MIVAHGVSTDLAFLREPNESESTFLRSPRLTPFHWLESPSRECLITSWKLSHERFSPSRNPISFTGLSRMRKWPGTSFLHCLEVSPRPLHTLRDLEKARAVVQEPPFHRLLRFSPTPLGN